MLGAYGMIEMPSNCVLVVLYGDNELIPFLLRTNEGNALHPPAPGTSKLQGRGGRGLFEVACYFAFVICNAYNLRCKSEFLPSLEVLISLSDTY